MEKGQAAMEYLMTYGWAILIIIVVVGALYTMGVFDTQDYSELELSCKIFSAKMNATRYEYFGLGGVCDLYFCESYEEGNYSFERYCSTESYDMTENKHE